VLEALVPALGFDPSSSVGKTEDLATGRRGQNETMQTLGLLAIPFSLSHRGIHGGPCRDRTDASNIKSVVRYRYANGPT
jgi:hypothetical protein